MRNTVESRTESVQERPTEKLMESEEVRDGRWAPIMMRQIRQLIYSIQYYGIQGTRRETAKRYRCLV